MAIVKSDHGEHQHVYGGVDRGGSIWFGEDFVPRRLKEGTYIVEFKKPFRGLPSPVCTIAGPEWITFNLSVAIVDVQPQFFICVTSSPERPIDSNFTFIAFGDA